MDIIRAVRANDLRLLQHIITQSPPNHMIPVQSIVESILSNNQRIFDYLLSLENVAVNKPSWDSQHIRQSPLYHTLFAEDGLDEYFALRLLEKGANLLDCVDGSGHSILHQGARVATEKSKLGAFFIKKGLDINGVNHKGKTPLYIACKNHNLKWIHMLLYYGADITIPSRTGILPMVVFQRQCSTNDSQDQEIMEQILFDYTFDDVDDRISISLENLVIAMMSDSTMYSKLVKNISSVVYTDEELCLLLCCMPELKPSYFRHFMNNYVDVFKQLAVYFDVYKSFKSIPFENLYTIAESSAAVRFFSKTPVCVYLLTTQTDSHKILPEVTKLTCLMASYGSVVTTYDLNEIYKTYGYCKLFTILQHFEILDYYPILPYYECRDEIAEEKKRQIIPVLCYDLKMKVDDFLDRHQMYSLYGCLRYFSSHKLKETCFKIAKDEGLRQMVRKLPTVPSLKELSRDVARTFIIDRYEIRNSGQLWSILKWLSIDNASRGFILYERGLYDV